MQLHLESVYGHQNSYDNYVKFLYNLMAQREPHQNISHKAMPSYEEHTKFVESKPYAEWQIIIADDILAGSMYLTKRYEVGLFIEKTMRNQGIGDYALKKLVNSTKIRPIYANINPRNTGSIAFFVRHGFTYCSKAMKVENGHNVVLQETYMLIC